jgi:Caspase domain
MSAGREALIVAVDAYDDPGLGQLRAPHRDAEALGDVLGDPRIGDFSVRVLRNETAQGIRVAVEDFFADRSPDDLLLLHFSCHGVKNAAGELYLAASDSRPDRLASTAVAADFVNQQMADSRAQRIALFLDCCYGGAFPRGMVVRASGVIEVGDAFAAAQQAAGGRGRVVVTASSSVEYAFEGGLLAPGAQVSPSVFTGSVVEGLSSGDADRDGDGWVGLNELFTYVAERVRRATPHQTPHLWAFGSEGDLLLAHSRRRRVTADALPPELVEAAGSSLAATRYGVAAELRDRLLGADLGQALAAWNALSAMVDDDSRRVSEFASAALVQAGLQVSPAALDLGTWPLGAPSVQELRLTGSPLALAATAESGEDWLRCEIDSDRVQVTVAPQEPGEYGGTLVLATPMGEHQVPVRVEVVAGAAVPKARSAPKRRAVPIPSAVPSARTAPASAPIPAPAPTPGLAPSQGLAPTPAAAPTPEPAGEAKPFDDTPKGEIGPQRLWLPVSVLLLVAAVGWIWAYYALGTLWIDPDNSNIEPSVLDGFGTAIVVMTALVLGAVAWPRLVWSALGVASGVALFYVGWSITFLDIAEIRNGTDGPVWTAFLCLGVATIAVVLLELRHRQLLGHRLSWRPPRPLEAGLLVVGAGLLFRAIRLDFDGSSIWQLFPHMFALLLPVVTLALTCWAILTPLTGERSKVIVAAALAYVGASFWALMFLVLNASAPFAKIMIYGEALLLLAVAARLGDSYWQRRLFLRSRSDRHAA